MKYFAVLLAAIAALAATAQSYLLWKSKSNPEVTQYPAGLLNLGRIFDSVERERKQTCRQLLDGSATIEILIRRRSDIEADLFQIKRGELLNRTSRRNETDAELEEDARVQVQIDYTSRLQTAIRPFLSFQNVEFVYFGNDEIAQFGFDGVVSDLPAVFVTGRLFRSPLSAESFEKVIGVATKLATRTDSIRSVCRPILLDADK